MESPVAVSGVAFFKTVETRCTVVDWIRAVVFGGLPRNLRDALHQTDALRPNQSAGFQTDPSLRISPHSRHTLPTVAPKAGRGHST